MRVTISRPELRSCLQNGRNYWKQRMPRGLGSNKHSHLYTTDGRYVKTSNSPLVFKLSDHYNLINVRGIILITIQNVNVLSKQTSQHVAK